MLGDNFEIGDSVYIYDISQYGVIVSKFDNSCEIFIDFVRGYIYRDYSSIKKIKLKYDGERKIKINSFKENIKRRIEIWLNDLYRKNKSHFLLDKNKNLLKMFISGFIFGAFEASIELNKFENIDEIFDFADNISFKIKDDRVVVG